MDMIKVSTAEFIAKYGQLADKALIEPVTITKNGRDRLVVISAEEYARLKRRDRQVWRTEEVPESYIELIRKTEAPEESAAFNREIPEGWTGR
ncbi:MAG: type II toxin-antitoxin system Phd/YefM family antitoxin [Rhodomicrobium sp.]|nr:type II toxin-antitoxin system Phd/YefM family antitoxin [Rhodomicrobium sp.]